MTRVLNLNQFKTFLNENKGAAIFLENHFDPTRSRDTELLHVQSNSFTLKTNTPNFIESNIYTHSWVQFEKAQSWVFSNNENKVQAAKYSKTHEKIFTLNFI